MARKGTLALGGLPILTGAMTTLSQSQLKALTALIDGLCENGSNISKEALAYLVEFCKTHVEVTARGEVPYVAPTGDVAGKEPLKSKSNGAA